MEGIGAELLGRQRGGEKARLVIVEIEDDLPGLAGKVAKQMAQLVQRFVVQRESRLWTTELYAGRSTVIPSFLSLR